MKLDATDLRYITTDEFRVLTAVEMGSKNHEVVPTQLIVQISGLRNGGVNKNLGSLAKRNLVARVQNAKYDGYRLTYGGYDYLAMRALSKRDSMYSVGNQIGVGKESGKRDYMGKRKSASWMYMSGSPPRKSGRSCASCTSTAFPSRPVDHARHCILMEFIDAYPLRQVADVPSPGKLYSELMDLIVRFARAGLIHGDFNEFNILIRRETGEPIVIDFPQMVSTSHFNAEMYFNRDVQCIRKYFRKRFRYESSIYPKFSSSKKAGEGEGEEGDHFRLDIVVAASGFKQRDQEALEEYMNTVSNQEPEDESDEEDEEEDEEEVGEVGEEGEEEVKHAGEEDNQSQHPSLDADRDDASSQSDRRSGAPSPSSRHSSRSASPSSLADRTAVLSLSASEHPSSSTAKQAGAAADFKEKVHSEVSKRRAREVRRYHSKKGAQRIGRPKGSKAKQDVRVKMDGGGFWD
ncbi:Rio2, N-terminal-domain-containing protein [Fomitopsis serialis]|uniref:Rio2, N-terminal-domain-containing protein n=1 Tax=Fomitopsis serialis TaxID=139415 RepID=UPI0020072098|nr:Rio2, N-terminal-domain-containing protein [Neoantrodia serialis]KAH9937126.1 Rio2, N-terminal-domain-containing protein [Neoantrodia serialis]